MAPLCSSSCWNLDISSWRPLSALFLSVEAFTPHLVSFFSNGSTRYCGLAVECPAQAHGFELLVLRLWQWESVDSLGEASLEEVDHWKVTLRGTLQLRL